LIRKVPAIEKRVAVKRLRKATSCRDKRKACKKKDERATASKHHGGIDSGVFFGLFLKIMSILSLLFEWRP
jgi:hypothetical protein